MTDWIRDQLWYVRCRVVTMRWSWSKALRTQGLRGNGGHHGERLTHECECGAKKWSRRHAIVETIRDIAITVTGLDL